MLKIKDNVDLKELEKYGFEYTWRELYESGYDKYEVVITIDEKDKILNCSCPFNYNEEDTTSHLETLYDIIKADLIEKIED